MKKIAILLTLLTVLALGALSASAQGPAVVIKDGLCLVPDENGNPTVFTTESHAVYSNDKNKNSKITCHAKLPAGATPPKKTLHWDSSNTNIIGCSTGFGFTQDWKAVVTPSGNVKLTCHINPNPIP